RLQQARTSGQPAIVELSADWCISCKVMERDILNQPVVRSAGLDDLMRIQLDVTDNTPAQRAWMTEQQLFGPPAFLFFDGQGRELTDLRIQGEVSREALLRHLQRASGARYPRHLASVPPRRERGMRRPKFHKNRAIMLPSDGIELLLDSCFFIRQTLPSFMTTESITHFRRGIV